jgi:hypothetical protein
MCSIAWAWSCGLVEDTHFDMFWCMGGGFLESGGIDTRMHVSGERGCDGAWLDMYSRENVGVWVCIDVWCILCSVLGEEVHVGTCGVVFGMVGSASVGVGMCLDVGGVFPGIIVCADVDMQVAILLGVDM